MTKADDVYKLYQALFPMGTQIEWSAPNKTTLFSELGHDFEVWCK